MTRDMTIIGKRFGRLTVLDNFKPNNNGTLWECLCDCGNKKYVYRGKLTTGATESCGCIVSKYGGLSKHPLYDVWSNIISRIENPNNQSYKHYGGRGISLDRQWKNDFISFYNWSINNGYKKGLSIDRINNDGDYTPENCQYITVGENTAKANRRQVRRKTKYKYWGVSPDGEEFVFTNASQFARENNLSGSNVRQVANQLKKTHKGWTFGFTNELNI